MQWEIEELYILAQTDVDRLNSDERNADKVPALCYYLVKLKYLFLKIN